MNTKTYWCDSCFSDSTTPKLCSNCGEELIDYENVLSQAKFVPPVYGQFSIDLRGDIAVKKLLEDALAKCTEEYFQNYHSAIDNGVLYIICNDIAAEKFINQVDEQFRKAGISGINLEFDEFPRDEKFVSDKVDWVRNLSNRDG